MACNEKNPLQRDGTSQTQRFLPALDPSSAPIMEWGMEEWLTFTAAFADLVNYYNLTDNNNPQGDWTPFFIEDKTTLAAFLAQAQLKIQNADNNFADPTILSDVEPHMALFMCFIMLLQHSQDALNQFTGNHLDFYYHRVLQLNNRPEVPDKVHVVFELARNLTLYGLPQGTALDAGKDQSAKPLPLVYQTNEQITVNSATIAAMKSLYQSAADGKLYYADVTYSADGLGTPFKDAVPKWNAFGNSSWPTATMGFSVASQVLLLSEGTRNITLTLTFSTSPGNLDTTAMAQQFKVFLTSATDWLQADFATVNAFTLTSTAGVYQLAINVTIPTKAAAIVPYNQTIHQENYQTAYPVMRLVMNVGDAASYATYQALSQSVLAHVKIEVAVTGMINLAVENDNGKLDPSKPFLAFGPQAKAGANLYIGSAEIFQKNWTTITPHITWNNVPADLKTYYTCYRKNYINAPLSRDGYDITSANQGTDNLPLGGSRIITGNDSFTANVYYLLDGGWSEGASAQTLFQTVDGSIFTFQLISDPTSQQTGSASSGASGFIAKNTYFNVAGSFNYQAQAEKAVVQQYTKSVQESVPYLAFPGFSLASVIQTQTQNFSAGVKENYMRITLTQDFLHSAYPLLYSIAMSIPAPVPATTPATGALIPNVPYTPEAATLTVDYTAMAENDVSTLSALINTDSTALLDDYVSRSIQFFHETPFGQAEQHVFLKSRYEGLVDTSITTIPQAPVLAGFYIGINNIATGSIASILFQVSEGSEDPTVPTFTAALQPSWYYLSGNEWLLLDKTNIISDDTNDMLRSGIIKFLIPDNATTNNTVFNQNLTWLGVQLPAGLSVDSVCKFINVHIQAEQATFTDNGNEPSHLQNGLPAGTISKLVNRLPQIKSVTQPYASFGGSLPEDDTAFTLRVSERLRHKHRAIDIWDYERLVMAQFPQVYRVKCLNHTFYDLPTNEYCEVAPGSVRVVVIPDIRNQNSFDPFEPRVSQNTLSEITQYLSGLNSLHIDLLAINPDYEEVQLNFTVKFYEGLDENFYAIQLNTDIISYLSPWAFNQNADIDFGGTLYKSVVIRFIEELSYVDYIADFKMYFTSLGISDQETLQSQNSRGILVSAKQHIIDPKNIPVCS